MAGGIATMRRKWNAVVVIAVLLLVSSVAQGKGIFQAQGLISDLQRQGDVISFRFTGKINFAYATAPAGDPEGQMQGIHFDVKAVSVEVSRWTEPYRPDEQAHANVTDSVYEKLAGFTKARSDVRLSLDNPGFSFSNVGELVKLSGTFVYAVSSDERH